VYETESAFCVIADMPGTRSDNIAISVESNMLTIDAKVRDRYAAMGTLRHQEYGVGDYHRSFRIGDGVNAEAITATYSNGVLEVNLPKAEAVVPRKIDIRTH
jgi:HSP20 family protein